MNNSRSSRQPPRPRRRQPCAGLDSNATLRTAGGYHARLPPLARAPRDAAELPRRSTAALPPLRMAGGRPLSLTSAPAPGDARQQRELILIDTSACAEFLSGTWSVVSARVDAELAGDVAICDAIRTESSPARETRVVWERFDGCRRGPPCPQPNRRTATPGRQAEVVAVLLYRYPGTDIGWTAIVTSAPGVPIRLCRPPPPAREPRRRPPRRLGRQPPVVSGLAVSKAVTRANA